MSLIENSKFVTEEIVPDTGVKLVIAIASNRSWAPLFGRSFGGLMLYLGMSKLGGRLAGFNLRIVTQAYLVTERQDALDMALEGDYTHLLYLDDDQTFPHDVVDRLLAHDKPIVTCNYRKKSPEVQFVCADHDNQFIDSRGKTGLERIFSCGMGITLIKLDALRKIPKPHFGVVYSKSINKFIIEDGYFANVMKVNGVDMWVDHDLSQVVGHVGETEYRISETSFKCELKSTPFVAEDVVNSGVVD